MCLYCVERKMSRFKNRKEDGGVVVVLERDNRLRSCKERRRRRLAGDLLDPCLVGGALNSRLRWGCRGRQTRLRFGIKE